LLKKNGKKEKRSAGGPNKGRQISVGSGKKTYETELTWSLHTFNDGVVVED